MFVYLLLLSLISFVDLQKSKMYTLCHSPTMDIYYTLCDERRSPTVYLQPCPISIKDKFNISLTWIPTMDLHRFSVDVNIWHQSMKVSETTTVFCSGDYDEYDFCGQLKGETMHFTMEKSFAKFPNMKVL
ncbi:Hypothetical predicted protein [Pelobates cultripes]|uniref:Lymphocyte antigen 96 n=1 Tax=Pelobates cultripes TaxID=61616 RepID=A0AAD1W214_PELCU|nr:Hypothetical predicted protein [Pelobates cultripes]